MLDVTVWGGQEPVVFDLGRGIKAWPEQDPEMPSDRQIKTTVFSDVVHINALTSRPAGSDWAAAARKMPLDFLDIGRCPDGWLRVEWMGDATEWLDVIGQGPDDCLVRLRLRSVDSGLEVVAMEMSAEPPGQISTTVLRRLGLESLGQLRDQVLRSTETLSELAGGQWCRPVRRPGRAGRPAIDYARWARDYLAAIEADPRAPIQYLIAQEERVGRYATGAQIRGYLNKARARGLLTPAPPGGAGGQLTDEAKLILGEG